jgi:Tol biopolymer transport system component
MKPNKLKAATLILLLIITAWLLRPETRSNRNPETQSALARHSADANSRTIRPVNRPRRNLSHDEAMAHGQPQGPYEYLFDQSSTGRFLLAKGRDDKFLPHSDAPSGMDLWLQDASGNERLISKSVYRAKFSPDGSKIAFTTSDCILHVQDLEGGQLGEVAGVYGANWKPDGSAVVFSKVGEGQDVHRPGTRQLAALDLATGLVKTLTDGRFDDGRPEFNPASDSIIFVSGTRSGLASFWQVSAGGGEPVQLTNVGLQEVNEHFVPPPYDKTIWSGDRRWFLYDFKSGDQQETWGLEFNPDGTMKQATKLADGINPRWQENGRTFVCERNVDGTLQSIVSNLP